MCPQFLDNSLIHCADILCYTLFWWSSSPITEAREVRHLLSQTLLQLGLDHVI